MSKYLNTLIKILNINAEEAIDGIEIMCLKMASDSFVSTRHCNKSNCDTCIFMSKNSPNLDIVYEQIHKHTYKAIQVLKNEPINKDT